ncbi:MAG: hypothetical protein A3G75_10975 [Verrucomicrobia bacterium RIFCSPLOWO2_12_FULL_64_8]|nr:MAG: hypothetical protein A3G75_10975 [Verrucomicrobia bacterium RIFCSPLOWO2_12_FULL_64_8]
MSFRYVAAFFLLFAAVLAGGCSSGSPISRIDADRALYESWPFEIQEAVLNGKVTKGMAPDMVRMALGKPTEVQYRTGRSGDEEIWIYRKSSDSSTSGGMVGAPTIILGGNVGGIGVMTDPQPVIVNPMNTPPEADESKEVLFRNGVVVRANF